MQARVRVQETETRTNLAKALAEMVTAVVERLWQKWTQTSSRSTGHQTAETNGQRSHGHGTSVLQIVMRLASRVVSAASALNECERYFMKAESERR